MENSPKERFFKPVGESNLKLVAPPMPQDRRFKPNGDREIPLNMPKEPGPAPKGAAEIQVIPAAEMPPVQPAGTAGVVPVEQDAAKILARMETLLKIEKRASELEEENELLLKMVNRFKAENAALKAK